MYTLSVFCSMLYALCSMFYACVCERRYLFRSLFLCICLTPLPLYSLISLPLTQVKNTKKIALKLKCKECDLSHQIVLKRAKTFELGGKLKSQK